MKALFYWTDGPTARQKITLPITDRLRLGPAAPDALPVPGGESWGSLILDQLRFYVEPAGSILHNGRALPAGRRTEVKFGDSLTFGPGGPTVKLGFEFEEWDILMGAKGGGYSPASAMNREDKVRMESVAGKAEITHIEAQVAKTSSSSKRRTVLVAAVAVLASAGAIAITIHLLKKQEQRTIEREREMTEQFLGLEQAVRTNEESLRASQRENEQRQAEARMEQARLTKQLETLAAEGESYRSKHEDLQKQLEASKSAGNSDEVAKLEKQMKELQEKRESDLQRQGELEKALEACRLELKEAPTQDEKFVAIQTRAEGALFLIACAVIATKPIFKDGQNRDTPFTQILGTGFVVDDRGTLVTCKHVVEPWKWPELAGKLERNGAKVERSYLMAYPVGSDMKREAHGKAKALYLSSLDEIVTVRTAPDDLQNVDVDVDGRRVRCRVESSWSNDVAILRLDPAPKAWVELASDEEIAKLQKGHAVMVSGFPLGTDLLEKKRVESSVSMGNVRKLEEFLQHTAPTCAGNSGGPIFNSAGKVVAMVSFTRVGELVQAVNMGIPAPKIRRLLQK